MAVAEIHAGRFSTFSRYHRALSVGYGLTDVDGLRPAFRPSIIEVRTNGWDAPIGRGTLAATRRLADMVGFSHLVTNRLVGGDDDLSQRVWLAYDVQTLAIFGVFAVVGNTWPESAITRSWSGASRLPASWRTVAVACERVGVETREIDVDADGRPSRAADEDWLLGVRGRR